ncbi:TPA: ead/Ea22-like family protein [Serratia marcescens]|nr:ead/Ea22-like family protein [Serratia marcescens]
MDKFSELKAAAMAATPGRIGDRIDGSGSIKYECTGYDGSLVLRTNHKDMEYGFVGDNADADELFFRLCVPDVVLELLAELEAKDKRIAELEGAEQNLCAANVTLDARASEAEARLATPVRLPNKNDDEFWFDDVFQVAKFDRAVERAISAAGFKFVGDE